MWVLCSSSAWFPLLTLPAWISIQDVSPMQLLCLISIADIVCMNFHPGCEFCAVSLLGFHCWHCLHKMPSSWWVLYSFFTWFSLVISPSWNPIQSVSPVQLLCLISNGNIACIKCHPESESCATPLLDFHCWHCLIIFYAGCESCTVSLLDLQCWHCLHEIPCRLWVLCSSFAWFPLLILFAWNPMQAVSPVQLVFLISIANIAYIKSHPESESCAALLDFHCQHCLHEISSRLWVVCSFSAWFWFLTYYLMYCLVCNYSNMLSSLHSINTPAFYRHIKFAILFKLNSM